MNACFQSLNFKFKDTQNIFVQPEICEIWGHNTNNFSFWACMKKKGPGPGTKNEQLKTPNNAVIIF